MEAVVYGGARPARDKGYAWAILACCVFLVSLSVGGLVGTFELMYTRFIEYYDVGEQQISWLGTLQCGAFGFAGWVSGPLAKRFSYRSISMFGSGMASVGLITAIFSDSNIIYVTYGLIAGAGFGMIHLIAIVAVQEWFDVWRCRALAIIFCGVGIGTYAWPPMCAFFLQTFSLGGTLLLLAGVQMQGMWCSALLRTFPLQDIDENYSTHDSVEEDRAAESPYHLFRAPKVFTSQYSARSELEASRSIEGRSRKTRSLSTGILENYRNSPEQQRALSKIASLGTQELINRLPASSDFDRITTSRALQSLRTFSTHHFEPKPLQPEVVESVPVQRRIRLDSNSIFVDFVEDNQAQGLGNMSSMQTSRNKRYTWSAFDTTADIKLEDRAYHNMLPGIDEERSRAIYRQIPGQIGPGLISSSSPPMSIITKSGVSVFTDMSYVIFILGSLVESMGFFTPLHYLPMRAVAGGKESHEVVLILSVFGVCSLLSRTVAGIVGDKYPSVRCWVCAASLGLAGLLTALTSFADHYTTLVIYASGLGVGAAFYLVLKNAVIVDLWGVSNMPYITGHLFACTGLAAVIMHPFTQFIVNIEGSFVRPFLIIGCLQFLGAIAMLTTTVVKIRQSI